jgi:heme A synthase
MPIFKRYYIADIPGLGWLAQYFTTFYLHYICAIVLMAILAYVMVLYWLAHRRTMRVRFWGYLRGSLLLIILATGVLLVFRNMPGYRFPPLFVAILDFTHLGMVLVFILVQITAFIGKRSWITSM